MNTPDEMIFDNLLDTSVDGNVFLEDLIEGPGSNVLEAAMKENMVGPASSAKASPKSDFVSLGLV